MDGRWWLSWTNSSTSGSFSVNSDKQEQEINCLSGGRRGGHQQMCAVVGLSALCLSLFVACVALSVLYESNSSPELKRLLFDYQNISDGYLALNGENKHLRGENDLLAERHASLEEQVELLNRTSAELSSVNAALSSEGAALREQIVNLTSASLQLTQEHERLIRRAATQDEERRSLSETIRRLVDSDAQREEEQRRLSEANGLLREELSRARDRNQEFLQVNTKLQEEIKNMSGTIGALLSDRREEESRRDAQVQERVAELQERNQNLSRAMMKARKEAEEREERRRSESGHMVADMRSVKEAYDSLDLYCPVVNHDTKERLCKTCESSWRLFENRCYFFSSRLLAWTSSRAWCRTQGSDLVVVDSEREQNFIFESSHSVDQSNTRLWIGMTDAEVEGEWLWVDGSSVTSKAQFWLSRPGMEAEPDDWKLSDPLGEDCGHIDTSEDTLTSWLDGSCETPYRWICEKNV